MSEEWLQSIGKELGIIEKQVRATADLLAAGGTVPFIARYRKEVTGSLDEVAVTAIRDRLERLAELDKRRQAIIKSLTERDLFTGDLQQAINTAATMADLEDIYLPYRPKRRTRSMMAREKGLEPLAERILAQGEMELNTMAAGYVDDAKGVLSADDALAGARDILAEKVSEDTAARAALRRLFAQKGVLHSKGVKGKEETGAKFRDYFSWQEPVARIAGHRYLAMARGEKEGALTLTIRPPEDEALGLLRRRFVKGSSAAAQQVAMAVEDGYKRLLAPSIETEIRQAAKERADGEAIRVFAENLRELLLAPPLGRKKVMALDPGFRTGAKLVCLDAQGQLLHNTTIYPTQSQKQVREAARTITGLCQRFDIEAIAIGNGTGGRETEAFVRSLDLPPSLVVVMVNESGASVYSASRSAREEFPEHDVTVRGAVSIGRRLMDPLAELVKIDPKAIGVGQYQHDVDQAALKRGLDDVVASCVNGVGVEVNTASPRLLTYVAGLGPTLAKNIIAWRNENGPFRTRRDLLRVPRLGPKAFEQCAGFVRIRDGKEPLDAGAVHPERYGLVKQMAKDAGCRVADLMSSAELRRGVRLEKYAGDTVGMPTLTDILAELAKPGRDPRRRFEPFRFAEGINAVEDLKPGMQLPGIATNVTKFGAFVDIGVHQDGLVHISQLADRFVKDPAEIVKVGQQVRVTVLEVDLPRKRIALSMRRQPELT